jgi:urease accessory protein
VPGAFVATLAAGAALAFAGVAIPAIESGVTVSLLVLGMLLTLAIRLPVAVGGAIVAAFALFHGYAHGSELPQAASPWWYAGGFVLATIILHALGMTAGVLWRNRHAWLLRVAGLSVLGGGIWLLAG